MSGRTSPSTRARLSLLRVPALLVVLALLPFFLAPYPLKLAASVLAFALLVISVDVLTGLTGLPSLGQIAYFGVGAYAAGMVGIHLTDSAVVQLAIGTVLAAAVALVTGSVAVRTSGIIFLMVTLAIGELTHQLADRTDAVGGSNGLAGIPPVTLVPGSDTWGLPVLVTSYWWVLVVFALGLGAALVVSRSPLGRSMRGVREAESRMASYGQRSYPAKLAAFTFAGALAGAAGTAWTAQARFVSPGDLAFSVSAIALLSVVLGGAGTLWGPIVGAAVVVLTRDYVSGFVAGTGDLLLGLLFVAAVYLLPRGIAGIQLSRRPPRREAEVAT